MHLTSPCYPSTLVGVESTVPIHALMVFGISSDTSFGTCLHVAPSYHLDVAVFQALLLLHTYVPSNPTNDDRMRKAVTDFHPFSQGERYHMRSLGTSIACVLLLLPSVLPFSTLKPITRRVSLSTSRIVRSVILPSANVDDKRQDEEATDSQKRIEQPALETDETGPSISRFRQALPTYPLSDIDKMVLSTALPSIANLAVVPLVNSVDTFWVGRMGIALALAGQSAANNVFFTLFFLVAFLPTITAPLVAQAKTNEEAKERVSEALFLCNVFGAIGTILMVGFPHIPLKMVLSRDAPAFAYAAPYLRLRAFSLIPVLWASTGFAAYRGLLNTVTPLKVSLATNALNLILDPIMIFPGKLGFVGAALATAVAEGMSGLVYIKLLMQRKLATKRSLIKPPSWKSLKPILKGGASMLARQAAINVSIVAAARRAQAMDPTGVSAAAYSIVMQMYSIGIVIHVAIQGTAATLVPSTLSKKGLPAARNIADRIFVWGTLIGILLGLTQYLALPILIPLFSTLPEVKNAVRSPAIIASVLHAINGPVFAGEGAMLGTGQYRDLAMMTALSVTTNVALINSPLGNRLDGILMSMAFSWSIHGLLVLIHHFRVGSLSERRDMKIK